MAVLWNLRELAAEMYVFADKDSQRAADRERDAFDLPADCSPTQVICLLNAGVRDSRRYSARIAVASINELRTIASGKEIHSRGAPSPMFGHQRRAYQKRTGDDAISEMGALFLILLRIQRDRTNINATPSQAICRLRHYHRLLDVPAEQGFKLDEIATSFFDVISRKGLYVYELWEKTFPEAVGVSDPFLVEYWTRWLAAGFDGRAFDIELHVLRSVLYLEASLAFIERGFNEEFRRVIRDIVSSHDRTLYALIDMPLPVPTVDQESSGGLGEIAQLSLNEGPRDLDVAMQEGA